MMASDTTNVAEAPRRKWTAAFSRSDKKPSPALVPVSHETQLQRYTPPGALVRIGSSSSSSPDDAEDSPASATYTLVVANPEPAATTTTTTTTITTAAAAASTPAAAPNFLEWQRFDEAILPPRSNPRKSRLERIFAPLDKLKAELPGGVSVEGFGGLAEAVHNVFHTAQRLDFMQAERTLHLPQPLPHPPLPRRELERLENELFDLSRYTPGGGQGDYLTALTWAEEGLAGSITLFAVQFEDDGDDAAPVGVRPVGVRPVAAMRDVPVPVLVQMRTHERVRRKAVFVPADDGRDGRLKWRANPSEGPNYATLPRRQRDRSANAGGGDGGDVLAPPSPLPSPPARRPSLSPSPRSQNSSHSRSHSRSRTRLADGDAVRATIPQFVALLHASRAILEDVQSGRAEVVAAGADSHGEVLTVKLARAPRPNAHDGDLVHVVVLMPHDAGWTDEPFLWTDGDGLAEMRAPRFWDLIEREPERPRPRSGSRPGSGLRSGSGRASGGGSGRASTSDREVGRTRSRSRHSRTRSPTRSPSRHLSLF
ncbi:hypothetical protein B0T26DRAFT_338147 [Lasiosphaeria miniovina]|uniref:Uncharacterized protein n=1 Tax=Lasiosphaeria miniovina TaxID=1954250 RepID=A0AA40AAT8_9PEZI|nr:uncharacterized protein B0T26DRAFT_338147 [Lasiosphaeria miniovina]KAK0712463.1 hypothetical protein B0T26DRAFT_338147 [Lasiosphaeria miniovina]